MGAYFYKKPFVMFNRVADTSRGEHPHAILGRIDDKFVSMNVTHSKNIFGKTTMKLAKNPEDSYLVTDDVYILPIGTYKKGVKSSWSGFAESDVEKMKQFVRSHKNIVR